MQRARWTVSSQFTSAPSPSATHSATMLCSFVNLVFMGGVHSGPPQCNLLPHTVYAGGDLMPMTARNASSAAECCAMCAAHPGCMFWTHDVHQAAKDPGCGQHCCWLKASPGRSSYYRANATSGCTSAVRAPNCSVAPHPPARMYGPWPVPGCSECPPFQPATNRTTSFRVEVSMADRLPPTLPTVSRQTIGLKTDYKPSVALLANGDLLLASLKGPWKESYATMFRSTDSGDTWVRMDNYTSLLGVEFHLRTVADGMVVFLIAGGYPGGGRVFRSTNFGYTFSLVHDWPSARSRSHPYGQDEMGWGLVEVSNSSATSALPVGVYLFPGNSIWVSRDQGLTWSLHTTLGPANNQNFSSIDSFFGQSFLPFLSPGGVLTHITRNGVDATGDQVDGSQVWSSDGSTQRYCITIVVMMACNRTNASFGWSGTDGGRNWACRTNAVGGWCSHHPCDYAEKPISHKPISTTYPQCANLTSSFGQPGTMYPHILRLADGRLLVTYTQRCNGMSPYHGGSPPSDYNAPACASVHDGYGTGLRAIVASESQMGQVRGPILSSLSFDLDRDVIVLKAQDDWFDVFSAKGCGCGCKCSDATMSFSLRLYQC